jgi:hypothetical protein
MVDRMGAWLMVTMHTEGDHHRDCLPPHHHPTIRPSYHPTTH